MALSARIRLRRLFIPSMVDIFFVVLFLAAFARPESRQGLLFDGDTGWHIRTGELILASGRVPQVDPFSFSRPGQPWFAWEWLGDVGFARLYAWHGMASITTLTGVVLSLACALLLAWLLSRGVGLWIGVVVTMAAVSASSVHFLARPHMFSILFYIVALALLDRDRRRRDWIVWTLVPLSALWANVHGGFVAWLATLGVRGAVDLWEHSSQWFRRTALLASLSTASTLINPYGWRLHQHIVEYLGASWILDHVQEFQSPNIRSEGLIVFAILLLLGAAVASRAQAAGERFPAVLVMVWGFAALRSARHIPFFAIAVAPLLASALRNGWGSLAERSSTAAPIRILWDFGQDLGRSRHASLWLPAAALTLVLLAPSHLASAFPAARFPVDAVTRNWGRLAPPGDVPQLLTSDQWADYVIFRMYPRQRAFFDGRSDFYGPEVGAEYRDLLGGVRDWRGVMAKYRFQLALLPRDWPLSTFLDREPAWRRVYEDPVAVLYARDSTPSDARP